MASIGFGTEVKNFKESSKIFKEAYGDEKEQGWMKSFSGYKIKRIQHICLFSFGLSNIIIKPSQQSICCANWLQILVRRKENEKETIKKSTCHKEIACQADIDYLLPLLQ